MTTRLATVLVMFLTVIGLVRSAPAKDEFARRAPYRAIKWQDDRPSVQVDGKWFELLAVDGLQTDEVVAYCKREWSDRWKKRFEEDLVEVLTKMGKAPGDSVALRLRDEAGVERTRERVPMTEDNRRALWEAAKSRKGPGRDGTPPAANVQRVNRTHAAEASTEFRELARRIEGRGPPSAPALSATQAAEDLDQLEWHLQHEYAYRDLRGVDYRAALDSIRSGLGDGISRGAFAIQIQKLLALFGDGHSGVSDRSALDFPGSLPFLVGATADGLVAFEADRSALLDSKRPYLVALDGVPVEKWLDAAGRYVARGSDGWRRERSTRALRDVTLLRRELGLAETASVRVTLAGAKGADPRTVERPITLRKPAYGTWPRGTTRMLDGNIGYLRIEAMDDSPAFVDSLVEAMQSFRKTKGLVIDVRGNGGGTRHALLTLLPYFLRKAEPTAVVNVAACRLASGQDPAAPEGYLADRFLYPATSSTWSDDERAAIARAAGSFRPGWTPPAGEFGAWHWLAVSRPTSERLFAYDRPVVVLEDGGCFSATDIFLGAFAGRPDVTLVGTPSGGGSARARKSRLAHSGIEVSLASMASYRVDGRMYDGAGIEPDVRVEPAPSDFLGATDAQLDAALARLR